jgi:hypothetical protein
MPMPFALMDRKNVSVDVMRIPAGTEHIHAITVRGYLVAVTAKIEMASPNWHEGMPHDVNPKFAITDTGESQIFGEFEIPIMYGMHEGGIMFNSALPNYNTAHPFYIRTRTFIPAVTVYTVHCGLMPR